MTSIPVRTLVLPAIDDVTQMSDDAFLSLSSSYAEADRVVAARQAVLALEAARRSDRSFGMSGLAARSGLKDGAALVASITGGTQSDARNLIEVGGMLAGESPWLASVADRVAAGEVSVTAAAVIARNLGAPSDTVDAAELARAAEALALEACGATPIGLLAAHAQAARDDLDAVGVKDREAARYAKRYLKLWVREDGMTKLEALLDPESAALVTSAFDAVTAPRRGGVRFVDPTDAARAQAVVDDPRTTEQLQADALVEMIRLAGMVDDSTVFGVKKPVVRIHVTTADLDTDGVGRIEGQAPAVSIDTVRRNMCTTEAITILFDDHGGKALNLGRTQRTYSDNQRVVLGAIWGGCAHPSCVSPPSWCEAHHADEWVRDHGETNIDTGVLLCHFHHKMLHDQHHRIRRRGGVFELIPPTGPPVELTRKMQLRRTG